MELNNSVSIINIENRTTSHISLQNSIEVSPDQFEELNISNEFSENAIKSDYNRVNEAEIKKIFYCPCCLSTVKIKFIDSKMINIKCQKEWRCITMEEAIRNFFQDSIIDLDKSKVINLYCIRHKDKKVFNIYQKYCINCKYDLCEDCNFTKRCESHDVRNLILEKEIKDYLENYINNYNEFENDEDSNNLYKIIKVLLYTYGEFPNIRTLTSLENAYNYLKKLNRNNIIKAGKFIKEAKDLSKKYLKRNKVFEIKIDRQNFTNIKFLSKILFNTKNVDSLVKLTLSGNNITTIKPLLNAKTKLGLFINLKHLDLSRNKLGDENIDYLREFDCKNLKEIYLHMNCFTDYTIINMINEKFNSDLRVLYIGFNRLSKNSDKLKNCNFPKLKKIGLNYIFNKNNYKNLAKIKMESLEELYIQNNGIDSFNFLKKMQLPNMKEIYLVNNETQEVNMDDFIHFSNLERIFLGNSFKKIKNFNKIKNLNKFKYIEVNNNIINSEIIEKNAINCIKDVSIEV